MRGLGGDHDRHGREGCAATDGRFHPSHEQTTSERRPTARDRDDVRGPAGDHDRHGSEEEQIRCASHSSTFHFSLSYLTFSLLALSLPAASSDDAEAAHTTSSTSNGASPTPHPPAVAASGHQRVPGCMFKVL